MVPEQEQASLGVSRGGRGSPPAAVFPWEKKAFRLWGRGGKRFMHKRDSP